MQHAKLVNSWFRFFDVTNRLIVITCPTQQQQQPLWFSFFFQIVNWEKIAHIQVKIVKNFKIRKWV